MLQKNFNLVKSTIIKYYSFDEFDTTSLYIILKSTHWIILFNFQIEYTYRNFIQRICVYCVFFLYRK